MRRQKSPNLFEKTSSTIFSELHDWQGLVANMQHLRLEKDQAIYLAVVGSKSNLLERFASDKAPAGVRLEKAGRGLSLFSYTRRWGRDTTHKVSGHFVLAKSATENIYTVVLVSRPRFWRQGILPLIEALYPRAVQPFLTQSELHSILRNVQKKIRPETLRVLEFSSKRRLGSDSRRRFQSVREWTDAELDKVFVEAKDRNDWFRSISFDFVTEEDDRTVSTGIRAALSKYGYFSCSGRFELFENVMAAEIVKLSASRLKFFANRERAATPNHEAKPLQITYDREVFGRSNQSKMLIEALRKFSHGTCTVLHANPYVHLSIVDNVDYSSADLWVLSQNQILLVPQVKASEAALKRIVNHIFENFREGTLSEYQEQEA